MRKSPLYLFLLVALTFAFGACKKDDNNKSNREQLIEKNWRMTAVTTDPPINFGGIQFSDLYAQFQDCDKDDLLIFKTNGTVNYDEGATKCDPTDPQTTTGVWVLNTDETVVTVDGESWTILEISDNRLKVKYTTDFFGNGVNSTITATFEKK